MFSNQPVYKTTSLCDLKNKQPIVQTNSGITKFIVIGCTYAGSMLRLYRFNNSTFDVLKRRDDNVY